MLPKDRRICPYCYSDMTNHIATNYLGIKWSIICPYCKRKIYRGKYGDYHKKGYILKSIIAFVGILLVLAFLYYMKLM